MSQKAAAWNKKCVDNRFEAAVSYIIEESKIQK